MAVGAAQPDAGRVRSGLSNRSRLGNAAETSPDDSASVGTSGSLEPLAGITVGVTADRRRDEQAELLRRLGASVLHGPTVRTLPLAHQAGVADATRALIARPPDVVVVLTAVGMRGWLSVAESLGLDGALLDALRPATFVVRGPKAAGAVISSDLEVAWRAPSEQSREVLAHLLDGPVAGTRIAVQRDGAPEPSFADALRAAGADVIDVPIYRWTEPADAAPARRLIDAAVNGRLDAVTFTSSPAIWNLLAIADEVGQADALVAALSGPVTTACVGPVCAAAATAAGIGPIVQPRRGRLGAMVAALAAASRERRRTLSMSGRRGVLQGAVLSVDGAHIGLTERERVVLEVLSERPGVVVSKTELLRRCWSDRSADPHTVEVTVGRLRRRLGAAAELETVPRRGYRLVP
jgi:uroporphyrinogen-III synthase